MSTTSTQSKKIHQGENVKRFREVLGWKQEALAIALGNGWTQKRISLLEGREVIDPEALTEIAQALRIPEDAIKNWDEEEAIQIIANTFNDHSVALQYYKCTINPMEKWLESLEEIKRLHEEIKKLYERLLDK